MCAHQRDRETETENEQLPPGGMAKPESLLHSPLRILGMHTHMPGVSFKPPGLGLKLWSTTWESSDIAITPTAGPLFVCFYTSLSRPMSSQTSLTTNQLFRYLLPHFHLVFPCHITFYPSLCVYFSNSVCVYLEDLGLIHPVKL